MKLAIGFVFLIAASAQAGVIDEGPAQYVVPAGAQGGPQAYAVGDAAIVSVAGDSSVLVFKLPEDLVGPQNTVALPEDSAALEGRTFSNSYITASCAQTGAKLDCKMSYSPEYPSLLDRAAIDAFLSRKYASDPSALAKAKTRAIAFQHDPEGELIF